MSTSKQSDLITDGQAVYNWLLHNYFASDADMKHLMGTLSPLQYLVMFDDVQAVDRKYWREFFETRIRTLNQNNK